MRVKGGYKYFVIMMALITAASSLVLVPQNEVLITPFNVTIVKYMPLNVNYNNSIGSLILINPTVSNIINELSSLPARSNVTQVMEFSGLLLLNGTSYLAYGVLEVKYTPINGFIYLKIYVSSVAQLALPQSQGQRNRTSNSVNSSLLGGNNTGISEPTNVGSVNPPYIDIGNTTLGGHVMPPGFTHTPIGANYNVTGVVSSTASVINSRQYPLATFSLIAMGLIFTVLLTFLAVTRLRSSEDCAVRGMRRIVNKLDKSLNIYRPNLTGSDIVKYLTYFISDNMLITRVMSMYEAHIYGDEPINCEEYNKLVKELTKMIKRL